jgi:protein transport protein SEC13
MNPLVIIIITLTFLILHIIIFSTFISANKQKKITMNRQIKNFQNDKLGCNAVSWAPFGSFDSQKADGQQTESTMRLVTGSCDNAVRFWRYNTTQASWVKEEQKVGLPHSDWIRDVAWAPNTAMPCNIIASCSEDRTVYIWKERRDENEASVWDYKLLKAFDAPVWRLSWSVTGNVLAVSTGDHQVTLWKQSVDGEWAQLSSV